MMWEPSIESADILPRRIYDFIRLAYINEMIELKRRRRISSRNVSVLFECRETVLFLIHELTRAENLNAAGIERTIAEYRCLIPRPGTLTATLFIDGCDAEWGAALARRISAGDRVLGLSIGPGHVPARVSAPPADSACPVHYLSFTIDRAQQTALLDSRVPVLLDVDDPAGRRRHRLGWDTRLALSQDLRGPWSREPVLATLLNREAGCASVFDPL